MNIISKAATIAAFLCLWTAANANAQIRLNFGDNSPMRKLQIAEMAISNLYVDSVNEQKLVEDGIRGMLKELDPHSSYTTAKETNRCRSRCRARLKASECSLTSLKTHC